MKAVVVEGSEGKVLFETDVAVELPAGYSAEVVLGGDDMRPEYRAVGRTDDLRRQFREIEETIKECAWSIHGVIKDIPEPEEVAVEFGITLGGEVGVPLVSKGTASANFKVSIKWTKG
jgi:hypothetical protein